MIISLNPSSSKRTRTKTSDFEGTLTTFLDSKHKINERIDVTLTCEEVGIMSNAHPKILLYVLNEVQSHTIVMGRQLDNVLRNIPDTSKLAIEVESLKKALSTASSEKKESLSQMDFVKKERYQFLSERNSWKSECTKVEKKRKGVLLTIEQLEEELTIEK